MKIDLKKVTFETPIWYKGIECRITHLSRVMDGSGKHIWTVCLEDKEYQEAWYKEGGRSYSETVLAPLVKVYTGNVFWECLEKDCVISNAIDFIREK